MKVSYEWLRTFFEEGTLPPVSQLQQKLTFHAFEIEGVEEVGGDSIIDIDVLPNRAADCLSHRGIAREIAALFDIPMKEDPLREMVSLKPLTESVQVTLDEHAACSYYIAAHITGVTITESPQWLQKRLEAVGQKSINNIVDATNYVLFDLGRPTHVFDANKFEGTIPHVGTRMARDGEKITLLGGAEVALHDTVTVITDAETDIPVAVGGIKGGTHADIDEDTTDIIIETANFNPQQIRRVAQALKLRTEASTRFENNIADALAEHGVVAVVKLILDIAGGVLQGYATAGSIGAGNTAVSVSTSRASRLLGVEVSEEEVTDILNRLQFEYSINDGAFSVTAPFERRDIRVPEEVIEEIGRVYGYNKIPSKNLTTPERVPQIHKKYAYAEKIRAALTSKGYTEVYLYSLRDTGEIKLINALASDKDHLRYNLAEGISEALVKNEKNAPLLGLYEGVKIFEIGNVFTHHAEETHVAFGVALPGKKMLPERTQKELHEAMNAIETALGKAPEAVTHIFQGIMEFNLDALVSDLPDVETYPRGSTIGNISYKAMSNYPFVLRDIAVWVPATASAGDVEKIIGTHAGDLLVRIDLFDTFEKEGQTSYAFHLVFQSDERTLNDKEVNDIMGHIETEIQGREGWEMR
tara:strand:+ start:25876 stop:27798 length:1923 start_codon:yes stop_codon:yes gene_type:complete